MRDDALGTSSARGRAHMSFSVNKRAPSLRAGRTGCCGRSWCEMGNRRFCNGLHLRPGSLRCGFLGSTVKLLHDTFTTRRFPPHIRKHWTADEQEPILLGNGLGSCCVVVAQNEPHSSPNGTGCQHESGHQPASRGDKVGSAGKGKGKKRPSSIRLSPSPISSLK